MTWLGWRGETLKRFISPGIFLGLLGMFSPRMSYGFFPVAAAELQFLLAQAGPIRSAATPAPAGKGSSEMVSQKADESSLTVQITPGMPPRRAASLRLAEEGRKLLQAGEYQTGLSRLEKAIALDSGNAYAYYYVAVAHFHLSRYRQSLSFLEIVGPSLADKPSWLSRVYALEGENYRVLRLFDRADRKYLDALTLDASNRVALAGLTSFPEEPPPPLR